MPDPAAASAGRTSATRSVRSATPDDVPALLRLVHELAVFEREPDAVSASEDDLRTALFADGAGTVGCEVAEVDGEVVGFALWHTTFSTWTGRGGLWLVDLFVSEAARGAGHGRALLAALARICVERGFPRLEWHVLDWNVGAQGVYRAVGAAPLRGWDTWRLSGTALETLAASA